VTGTGTGTGGARPAATSAADIRRLAAAAATTADLDALVSHCRACPRLVEWREAVASRRALPRAAYAGETYWGRPVPSWGPADARIVVVGLAPAAHGGNRTGRIFTGDRSGDWLFLALHEAGLAALPTSRSLDDGQALLGTRVVAAVHCAPPANRPTPQERDACAGWLEHDFALLRASLRVVVALGGFGWAAMWPALSAAGHPGPRPRPPFRHGAEVTLDSGLHLLGCYHPSQQNTFTGRLTPAMLVAVFSRAAALAAAPRADAPLTSG